MEIDPHTPRARRRPWLILATLAAIVAVAWGGQHASPVLLSIVGDVRAFGVAAPVAFTLVYAISVALLIPSTVLSVAGGALFGFWIPAFPRRSLAACAGIVDRVSARPSRRGAFRGAASGVDAALPGDRAGGQHARTPHRISAALVAGRAIQFSELCPRPHRDLTGGLHLGRRRDGAERGCLRLLWKSDR